MHGLSARPSTASSWSSLPYSGGGSGDFITLHIPDIAAGRAFVLAGKVYDRIDLTDLQGRPGRRLGRRDHHREEHHPRRDDAQGAGRSDRNAGDNDDCGEEAVSRRLSCR